MNKHQIPKGYRRIRKGEVFPDYYLVWSDAYGMWRDGAQSGERNEHHNDTKLIRIKKK